MFITRVLYNKWVKVFEKFYGSREGLQQQQYDSKSKFE